MLNEPNELPPLGTTKIKKVVPLSEPFTHHGKTYKELHLCCPTAAQFLDIGQLAVTFEKNGIESVHELPGVLLSYLQAGCCTNVDANTIDFLLDALPLVDGIRLRRRFADFFTDAINIVLAEERAAMMADIVAASGGARAATASAG